MLTVLCWLWRDGGRRPGMYKPEHVDALARMLKVHMSVPYRLLCVTDSPDGIKECETFPLWHLPVEQTKNLDCYRRLKLFDPEWGAQMGERILSIDLDVVIRDDLAPLIDYSLDFQGMSGTSSHINGSLWTLKIGTNSHVWDSFEPKHSAARIAAARTAQGRQLVGSDQAWMSLTMPNAHVWGTDRGMWHYKKLVKPRLPEGVRMVAFPGDIKPWDAHKFPSLREEYMAYL